MNANLNPANGFGSQFNQNINVLNNLNLNHLNNLNNLNNINNNEHKNYTKDSL